VENQRLALPAQLEHIPWVEQPLQQVVWHALQEHMAWVAIQPQLVQACALRVIIAHQIRQALLRISVPQDTYAQLGLI